MSGMTFEKRDTPLSGVYLLKRAIRADDRGIISKTFNGDQFRNIGLDPAIGESIYSISQRNVLRGMHFQRPPHDHAKLVHVIEGEILDVVVGVGFGASTGEPGQSFGTVLSPENGLSMYISPGYAHGFLVLSERAIVSYVTSTGYEASHDTAIHFNSFNFQWPENIVPLVSDKDAAAPGLDAYLRDSVK